MALEPRFHLNRKEKYTMTLNVLCLIIWIVLGIDGLYSCIKGLDVNKVVHMCAILICILHYIEIIFSL